MNPIVGSAFIKQLGDLKQFNLDQWKVFEYFHLLQSFFWKDILYFMTKTLCLRLIKSLERVSWLDFLACFVHFHCTSYYHNCKLSLPLLPVQESCNDSMLGPCHTSRLKLKENKMKSCKMFLKDFVFQPTCDILESSVRSDATFHSTRTSCDVFWVGRVKFIAAFLSAFATCVTFEWFFSYWKRKC